VVGGTRFWERAEIKDALAYLRLVAAPDDALAFRRAVNVPARGIGAATIEHLERAADGWQVSLPEAARRLPEQLTARARLALERFTALVDELRELAGRAPAGEVVERLLEQSGLAAQYAGDDEEDRDRRANLDQLIAAAAEAADRGLDLAGFVDEVALLTDADARASAQAVRLSTLHAAKGLEFDTVFLVGLEERLLPLRREGTEEVEEEEEERRLAYVGMTRAKRELFLTTARVRRLHGQLMPGQPSRFLLEVPREVVEERTAAFGRDPFRSHLPRPHVRREAAGESAADAEPRRFGAGSRKPHPEGWRPALKVRHPTFGVGVILQVQGTDAQTRLVVFFERAGRKVLIPALAKLEKA
jgi:DNA helicase-2/ATP-dependent DNA helicase PcrA